MKLNYIGFAKRGDTFGPASGNGEFTPSLPAGHYRVSYDRYEDALELIKFVPKTDEILNLGNKEFNQALNVTRKFLAPDTVTSYAKAGFLLKRSFLFYGPPGTGKSVLATQLADEAIKAKNAVAIYPEDFLALERILQVLDSTDPDRFKVVALEEFDDLIHGHDEGSWTTLLDGQFQSANRLLIATTNNVNDIPQRLLRPGRFSSLVYIPSLTSSERELFLKSKGMTNDVLRAKTVEATNNFTIDELKEVVQSVLLLGENVDSVIENIKACKALGGTLKPQKQVNADDDFEDDDE